MATEKETITEQISELHPKDNRNIVVYPKTKSECIIDKIDDIPGEGEQRVVTGNAVDKTAQAIYDDITAVDDKLTKKVDAVTENVTALDTKTENMNKVIPTDLRIVTDTDGSKKFALFHDSEQITGQVENIKLGDGIDYDSEKNELKVSDSLSFESSDNIIFNNKEKNSFLYALKMSYFYKYYDIKSSSYGDLGVYEKNKTYAIAKFTPYSYIFSIGDQNENKQFVVLHNNKIDISSSGYPLTYAKGIQINPDSLSYSESGSYIKIKYPHKTKEDTLACLSDIPTVWTSFRHTIDITGTSSDGNRYISLRFTTLSSKNTPVDSFQDLFTLFASTKLEASGSMNNNDTDAILAIIKGINVGTAVTDTTIEFTDKTTETISSYATDLTITDDVTQD